VRVGDAIHASTVTHTRYGSAVEIVARAAAVEPRRSVAPARAGDEAPRRATWEATWDAPAVW